MEKDDLCFKLLQIDSASLGLSRTVGTVAGS